MSVMAMMMTVGLVLLAAALGMVAWQMRSLRQATALDTQRVFEQLDLIRGELLMLSDRLDVMQTTRPPAVERPVTAPAPMSAGPGPRGYEVAARLARSGATCDELMSGCGLSRHEAELLLRIHKADVERQRQSQSAAHSVMPAVNQVVNRSAVQAARPANGVAPGAVERRSRLSLAG